jgi:uroporphyrin-III C-methyltransferase/precorrin-2 dehydrogenase/sirohydrochlorin ferrochelatase
MTGFVSLVGAGPGDPELLTLKAADRLKSADLVLYDALVDPAMLRLAPKARWFYVGKRAGRASITQEEIERLLIRSAKRGERVVRLKCGDPFVFGRGGEEALALVAAGVPCEVIPGVSSAVAAPGLAGIPVTHRGLSTAFTVISGHAETAYAPVLQSLAPHSATVVVLMGLGRRAAIAAMLVERGWSPSTPAAILLNASHQDAAAWTGSLSDLGKASLVEEHEDAAGVIVIGSVVSLAATLGPLLQPAGQEVAAIPQRGTSNV